MKGKIVGCLAALTSMMVCAFLANQLFVGLFGLGRAAVQLGLAIL